MAYVKEIVKYRLFVKGVDGKWNVHRVGCRAELDWDEAQRYIGRLKGFPAWGFKLVEYREWVEEDV